jgi:hypothetical protein
MADAQVGRGVSETKVPPEQWIKILKQMALILEISSIRYWYHEIHTISLKSIHLPKITRDIRSDLESHEKVDFSQRFQSYKPLNISSSNTSEIWLTLWNGTVWTWMTFCRFGWNHLEPHGSELMAQCRANLESQKGPAISQR